MDDYDLAQRYEQAAERMQRYIHRSDDGTFILDIMDAAQADIHDPVIFADLKRSLEETNRLIRNELLDPRAVEFP
jgi:hypothetical protein